MTASLKTHTPRGLSLYVVIKRAETPPKDRKDA
jgi:hypothetical protein